MKKFLLKDIAKTLGLSISQVSRAMNHRERVSDETRTRVLRLVKKMKYRNRSWRHRMKIAVLTESFYDFNVHILNQIIKESHRMRFSFAVITIDDLDQLNNQYFDGAILISKTPEQLKWCEKFKIPLVVINQYGEHFENIASVFPDADHEVRTAMTHFIELGHKKIARIRFSKRKISRKNLARGTDEFYRVAEMHGIRGQVCSLYLEKSDEEAIETISRLADGGYTAFLVVISDWTPHLLQALQKAGRRVPEDISLITYEYDNSACMNPPQTTIEYNYEQLVRKAVEQLKNEIAGKKIIPEIHVPCRLNIRCSTAAPPKKKKSKN